MKEDWQKYEKARELKDKIGQIRQVYLEVSFNPYFLFLSFQGNESLYIIPKYPSIPLFVIRILLFDAYPLVVGLFLISWVAGVYIKFEIHILPPPPF